MDKSKKIFYENVIPTISNKTVNVNFKDNSDLIFEEQKNKKIQFARKLNNFFFFFSFNISYFYNDFSLQNIFR